MYNRLRSLQYYRVATFLLAALLLSSCQKTNAPATSPGDDPFFKEKNAQHNNDYLATYPLHNPDSCIIRLKAEVPLHLQPWACLSLWYHLPRTSPQVSFGLLERYDQNYPHDTVFAFTQMMRGEFLVELQQLDSARTVLADARNRYLRLNRLLDASDADYLIARCYNYENNTPKALETYLQVLELINRHDTTFSHRHAFLYQDMATAYGRSKNYPEERYWLKKAWDGDPSGLDQAWKYKCKIALRFSANYSRTEQPDSALVMAKLAAEMFQANTKGPLPPQFQYRLGFAYFKKGDCSTALPLLLDAYHRNTKKADPVLYEQMIQAVGESYFCLGKLDSAEWFIRQSLTTADTGNLTGAHKRLSDIYARRGDYKAALAEIITAHALYEQLYAIERSTALAEFETRYETAKKEGRIRVLENEQKIGRLQNQIIGLLLLSGVGVLLSLFLRQRGRHRILEQDKQLLTQEKELSETRTLLHAQELERSQTALKNTLDELDTTARLLTLKTQLIEELELRLSHQHLAPPEEAPPGSTQDNALRSMKILTETDWLRFRERFDQQLPGFIQNLKINHPALTTAEIRLFLLMKLDFDNLEISEALGISKDSVYRSRHRLSKKLGLPETGNLDEFVQVFM